MSETIKISWLGLEIHCRKTSFVKVFVGVELVSNATFRLLLYTTSNVRHGHLIPLLENRREGFKVIS